MIYGGGNTAMDAARTARRLGAEEALIVYRRDRAHMPAHGFEADEAMEEGVRIQWLTTIKEIVGATLKVERMTIDDKGRPQPTGEFDTLEADSVVLALGQVTDSDFLRNVPGVAVKPDGVVEVDRHMMTGHPGMFAGGDMVPSAAHRHGGDRPRQAGGAQHRCLAAGWRLRRAGAARRWLASTCCICRCSATSMCRSSGGWKTASGSAVSKR